MVPIYLRYLGIEAFALIAFGTVLQAWLTLLDIGLSPTLSRELARYRAGVVSARDAVSLTRTFEIIFWALGIACVLLLTLPGYYFAANWFTASSLLPHDISMAIVWMGPMIGFRWVTTIYRSGLLGLDHQATLNTFTIGALTSRYCLVVPLIAVWPSVQVFFAYQAAIAIAEVLTLRQLLHHRLPQEIVKLKVRKCLELLRDRASFSLSVAFTGMVWVLVTQFDKLILAGFLTLEDYGQFSLAVILAGGILLISSPIGQTFQPRLSFLAAAKDIVGLSSNYHLATQLIAVVVLPIGAVMTFLPILVLHAWTGASNHYLSATILSLYAAGNSLLALLIPVAALQVAFGRMRLHVIGNLVFAFTLTPLLYWAASRYGGLGAGWVWLGQNVVFCSVWVAIVHSFLRLQETREWYFRDVFPPLIASLLPVAIIRFFLSDHSPQEQWRALEFCVAAWALSTLSALLAARRVRSSLIRWLTGVLQRPHGK